MRVLPQASRNHKQSSLPLQASPIPHLPLEIIQQNLDNFSLYNQCLLGHPRYQILFPSAGHFSSIRNMFILYYGLCTALHRDWAPADPSLSCKLPSSASWELDITDRDVHLILRKNHGNGELREVRLENIPQVSQRKRIAGLARQVQQFYEWDLATHPNRYTITQQ